MAMYMLLKRFRAIFGFGVSFVEYVSFFNYGNRPVSKKIGNALTMRQGMPTLHFCLIQKASF